MKLIVGVFLSLALLESFHCAPLIGSDDGKYTATHSSSSWGFNAGLNRNIGLEGGFQDGHAIIRANKHFSVNVEGHKENDQKDVSRAVTAAPPPNNFGIGYPYGIPNNPANGSPYYIHYTPQPPPQFAPQWPQYAPQQALQFAPQYAYPPQYAPLNAPQYVPQGALQYSRQGAPQYAPQDGPHYATPNGAPDSSQRTTIQYNKLVSDNQTPAS